jgi:hypothetical protein
VTLVDKRNYHLFRLLYQVASILCSLLVAASKNAKEHELPNKLRMGDRTIGSAKAESGSLRRTSIESSSATSCRSAEPRITQWM